MAENRTEEAYALYCSIHSLRQGSMSITVFFTTMKELWEAYSSLAIIPTCNCHVSAKYDNMMQQQQLFQLLMGLSESFQLLRSQILSMSPLPLIDEVYLMLLTEEALHIISNLPEPLWENSAMMARGGSGGSETHKQQHVGDDGYEWRKHGENPVEGTETTASYYGCAYPDCPSRKWVVTVNEEVSTVSYDYNHEHRVQQQQDTPIIVIQVPSEKDVVKDGYKWKRYGKKEIKDNPYPRFYFRCKYPDCQVKKHVQRASDDAREVITTYQGRHIHEVPTDSGSE